MPLKDCLACHKTLPKGHRYFCSEPCRKQHWDVDHLTPGFMCSVHDGSYMIKITDKPVKEEKKFCSWCGHKL